MMAPDRRRRSPEGSSISRRRKDSRADYNEPPRMRATPQSYPYSSSSSSSSSNSIIDISHSFPPKRSGIRTFFTAPSERRLRKRRSSRLMKNNNSSSSSVNSNPDLAYGHGYIKRPKLRRVRSRSGREIDREKYGERYHERHYERQSDRFSDREGGKSRYNDRNRESTGSGSASGRGKLGTTAEILAVGAGLRAIASEQNKRDLREARIGKRPEMAAIRDNSGHTHIESRGIGSSRVSHGADEDGWESASDSESSVDSRLAFGNDTSGGWSLFGRKRYKPMSRKSSVVDPRLFGPANSLHGVLTQPVGFGDVSWTSTSDFGEQREVLQRTSYSMGPQQSHSSSLSQVPLQQVPPMPMSEVDRTEPPRFTSEPQSYTPIRPDPVPIQIQQPKPFTPVSQSVYEPIHPTRSEPGSILKKTPSSSGRGKSLAEVAVAGVAAAAVGSMISSARDDRKDRQRKEEIDALERDRIRRLDSEQRETKDGGRRDKRSSPPREDRKEKRRDKEREETEERRRERKRDERRGETRDEKEERREKRREERRAAERADDRFDSRRTKSEASVSTTSVDPFQFQVDRDAFPTPTIEASSGHKRIDSLPTVVTVEREPDFSRKRSSSIKDQSSAPGSESRRDRSGSQKGYSDRDEQEKRYNAGQARDRVLHDAEATIQDAKHFTGPYEPSVVTAVVAAEHHRETRADERRRERHREANYDDYETKLRDETPVKDPIQEEADRAYREIVMARKIASQVIRSRSPSPDPSVVHKYDNKDQEQEIIRIVTPPGMEEHKGKGPYDAPNADFRLDHVLDHPRDLETFSIPSFSLSRSNSEPTYLVRDPDASKPRPLLNLVRPTPTPSPLPEKQLARSDSGRKTKSKESEPTKRSSSSDIVIGPKGNIIASPTVSAVSKGVTWGENETKHYEVESPSEHRDEFVSNAEVKSRDKPTESAVPKGGKGWGAIAAGIIGAGIGASAASEISKSSKPQQDFNSAPYEYRGVVVEPESPPRKEEYRGAIVEPESPPRRERQRSPPSPGPKPTMPQSARSSHMPGAFDDDLDFTATVAAGLQDTGFDPNIVIDDPTFRRRDSPPGSNDTKFYQAPFAETVTDLGVSPSEISRTRGSEGFIIGEVVSTPKDWPVISPTENDDSYSKLSKKEQKKRDKAAKRQSVDSTPIEDPIVSREILAEPESYFEAPLSKKEQKKRDKAAKRQSIQADDAIPISEQSVTAEVVQEPNSYFETPKKSKKSKESTAYDNLVGESPRERTVSVPVDAFDDLRDGQDEWVDRSQKSKKKSKRDSERYDSPARSAQIESTSELERSGSKKSKRGSDRYESPARSAPSSEISSSSKKSKDKSSRPSGQFDYDPIDVALPASGATSEISSTSKKSKEKSTRRSEQYEYDPTEISLPPSTPSETSRDGDYEDARSTRRSSTRDSGIFNSEDRGESRSVVSTGMPRYDEPEPRKKKKSRSGTSDYDDLRSVASAPAGDDYDDKKGKKRDKKGGGIFSGLFGSKSEVGVRDESPKRSKDDFDDVKKKSKKSKRSSVPDSSSIYGEMGSVSVNDLSKTVSNGHRSGNGSYANGDGDDDAVRSDGEKRKKTRSRSESTSSKKDSFLDKAGTLGAGVGLAGVAVAAIAAQQYHQQSKAENANSNTAVEQTTPGGPDKLLEQDEILDPEITQRQFRPSIDPQYGDLLPLPPSDPASPNVEPLDDLPNLPDSRPDTPESERLAREKLRNAVRRTVQDTPIKSPSQSQVPLVFKMGGNRSIPPSPSANRASPLPPSANPSQESLGLQRHRSRPTSWDNSKEFKPLYLVESTRRGSNVQLADDEHLPELPPSQRTSRSSSQLDDLEKIATGIKNAAHNPLSVDTTFASASNSADLLGSGQSTPKANLTQGLDQLQKNTQLSDLGEDAQSTSPAQGKQSGFSTEDVAKVAVAAGLVSSIGYFASSPSHPKTSSAWLDELPSAKAQELVKDVPDAASQLSPVDDLPLRDSRPWPVDPVSKDRSSYLLRSSPMSKKSDDIEFEDLNIDSPISKQPNRSERDMLESIQEKEYDAEADDLAHDVSKDRQETLETLSGLMDKSAARSSLRMAQEPEADFSLPKKSKKDKKKDKKVKGLSHSDMQDDSSLPVLQAAAASQNILATEAGPAEDLSTPKPKKDKKGKKKSKSMPWDENEPEPQTPSNTIPISLDKSDSDTFFDADQGPFETKETEEVTVQVDDISTPTGKKGKKNRKKQSALVWEPEESETRHEAIEDMLIEPTQNPGDMPKPRDMQQDLNQTQFSAEVTTPVTDNLPQKPLSALNFQASDGGVKTLEQKVQTSSPIDLEEKSTSDGAADGQYERNPPSKKKGKKGNRKFGASSDWGELEVDSSLRESEPLSNLNIEVVSHPAVGGPVEESLSSKSKKDKKKDKKKAKDTSWEAEELTTRGEPMQSGSSYDTTGGANILHDAFLVDGVSVAQAKNRKAKKSKAYSWESEHDIAAANDSLATADQNREINHGISEPAGDSQSRDDFSLISNKDKDGKPKDNLPAWDAEVQSASLRPISNVPAAGIEEQGPTEDPFEEFSTSKKKDRKKDKKKGKSASSWEPDSNKVETPLALGALTDDSPAVQKSSPPLNPIHSAPNLDEKKESAITQILQDSHEHLGQPSLSSPSASHPLTQEINKTSPITMEIRDLSPDTNFQCPQSETISEILPSGDFGLSQTIKSENKSKSTIGWADEVESSTPEVSNRNNDQSPMPDTVLVDDSSFVDTSKKGKKKKKNKSVPAWERDEEIVQAKSSLEVEDTVISSSVPKKDKKNRQSVHQRDESESAEAKLAGSEIENRLDAEAFESFSASSSKKGKKKSRSIELFSGHDEKDASEENSKVKHVEELLGTEIPLSRPTPVGGPGGWPVTPTTPMTGDEQPSDDNPGSASKGYFPAAAAAVSAAILGAKVSQDGSSSHTGALVKGDPGSTSIGVDQSLTMDGEPKILPDGLASGYDNDQLSLARQLQEEFGKKSSKKDKKKRQSLPSTPAIPPSRSRTLEDDTNGRQRARSLSIGPAVERSAISPVTSERKIVYSEDQLELARQLKAEFESGSKKSKSKKSKKGRSVQDDDAFEKDFDRDAAENVDPSIAGIKEGVAAGEDSNRAKPDGFAAGYQEDQLSLARQLQADFAKKASKKDKKHRSTSQTPAEHGAWDDSFGDQNENQVSEPMLGGDVSAQPGATVHEDLPPRDGLAVGYKVDQLELARQLKEEFGSASSKKKGKDKKDKKHGSLVRSNTDDDFLSSPTAGSMDEHCAVDSSKQDIEKIANDDDGFDTLQRKSRNKKDKKGKRASSLISSQDDVLSSESVSKEPAVLPTDSSLAVFDEQLSAEPASAGPGDEYASIGKKDKKSNKTKKRDSLVRSTTDDDFSNNFAKQVETIHDATEDISSTAEVTDDPIAKPDAEFGFSTKKSKKDKKKRQSSTTVVDDFTESSINDSQLLPNAELSIVNAEDGALPEAVGEPDDDFGFLSSKKDKKKKRGSLLRNESFNINFEEKSEVQDQNSQADNPLDVSRDLVIDEQQDVLNLSSSKKSKKDKKKRGSLLRNESFNASAEEKVESGDGQIQSGNNLGFNDAGLLTPVDNVLQSDFQFLSGSSEQNRESLRTSTTLDDVPEPLSKVSVPRPEANTTHKDGPALSASKDGDQETEVAPSSQKSGGDEKENPRSTQQDFIVVDPLKISEEHSSSRSLDLGGGKVKPETQDQVSFAQPSSHSTTNRTLDEENEPNRIAFDTEEKKSEDVLEDSTSTKEPKKKDLQGEDVMTTDFEDSSGLPTQLGPLSESKIGHETFLPTENVSEKPRSDDNEEQSLDLSVTPATPEPVDDWDDFSSKKSNKKKKKNRKELSKLDSEKFPIPSEPILESSKDVALTPLPLDQTARDSVLPEPREIDSTTPALQDGEDPVDEWASFSPKPSNKKGKKKQKNCSKTGSEAPSGNATPLEKEPDTGLLTSVISSLDDLKTNSSNDEQSPPQASDESKPVAVKEIEEPADDWGSFTVKKTKKGKKDKKSGSSTPVEPAIVPPAANAFAQEVEVAELTPTNPEDVQNQDDLRGAVQSKKSKKEGKSKKLDQFTPTKEALASMPEHNSLDHPQEMPLRTEPVQANLEEVTEQSKEFQREPLSNSDDKTLITDPIDEWGAMPTRKSKDKKKNRGPGIHTPVERASIPSFEQLGADEFSQSSMQQDIDPDNADKTGPSIETKAPVVEQGDDDLGAFSSKKDKKKKDKKNKDLKPLMSLDAAPSPSQEADLISEPVTSNNPVAEATAMSEVSPDAMDASEAQGDDGWATSSIKPSKKGRKKQRSDYSTPLEEVSIAEIDEKPIKTGELSSPAIVSIESARKNEQTGNVQTKQVLESNAEDSEAFSLKSPKKGKKINMNRSSSPSPPIEPSDIPAVEQPTQKSDISTIQPVSSEQVIIDPEEPVAHPETREGFVDHEDEWGVVSDKQSKSKGKQNRKSGLSTPVEGSLPHNESELLSEPAFSGSVQQNTVSTDTQEDTGPAQTVETIVAQDEGAIFSAFSSKKSKKKSRHSGISTPVNESLPDIEPALSLEPSQTPMIRSGEGDMSNQDKVDDPYGQADEWSLPLKKSKNKKQKSSKPSTPSEEPSPSNTQVTQVDPAEPLDAEQNDGQISSQGVSEDLGDENNEDKLGSVSKKKDIDKENSSFSTLVEASSPLVDNRISSDSVQQAEITLGSVSLGQETAARTASQEDDDWGSVSVRRGKKDKKRKSGHSTPIEQISTSLPKHEVSVSGKPTMTVEGSLPQPDESSNTALEQDLGPAENPGDEWTSSSKKKSKDKKRKSGTSTPIEDLQIVVEAPSQLQNTSPRPNIADLENIEKGPPALDDKAKDRSPSNTEEKDAKTQENLSIQEFSASVPKKVKKSKKDKRKSDNSTAIDEGQILDDLTPIAAANSSDILDVTDHDQSRSGASHSKVDDIPPQPVNEVLGLTPEKSEDKESKKEPRASSESASSIPAPQTFSETGISSIPLDFARVASPVAPEHSAEEQDLFASEFSRKLSKKDKRKRQPTVDVASDSLPTIITQLTSWADEVEEAEVVRALPVIQDIANDESLSHIAPAVMATSTDDFLRPSKKGKKGTKRNSISTKSAPVTDSFQKADNRDLPHDSTSSTEASAIMVTGATIASAALLAKAATSHDDASAGKGQSTSGAATPARKPSKREKKKKSIDRRVPQKDDIFDDPALWEGADPKIHEEITGGDDDDDDGFWKQEEQPTTLQKVIQGDNAKDQPIPDARETTLSTSSDAATLPELQFKDAHVLTQDWPISVPSPQTSSIHNIPESRGLPGQNDLSKDRTEKFAVSSYSKTCIEKEIKSNPDDLASRDPGLVPPINQSATSDIPTSHDALLGRVMTFDQQRIDQENLMLPRNSFEQQSISLDSPAQKDFEHIQSRPQSRSFQSRISDLPVVHEEISTQLEADDGNLRGAEANRDSAFVTGSPIPSQRGFEDNYEHVRDSGVHLRDFSPAEKARAPIKSTDEALARLSWPSIDEESETVNLNTPQRPKDTRHHTEERLIAGSQDSRRPKGDTATDFYRVQRLTPTKHLDLEAASRDLLPSQRNKEEKHTDLHRSPTIYRPQKTEAQSLVKQRLQQFQQSEATDLARTPRPKLLSSQSSERLKNTTAKDSHSESPSTRSVEKTKSAQSGDEGRPKISSSRSLEQSKDDQESETPTKSERPTEDKYRELTSASRPRAEKPKGISEIEAGAVLAGASLGFAAARKLSQEQRPTSAQSQRSTSNSNINRLRTPDIKRPDSVSSNRSGTPPLRRSDRKSGDLRSLSQRSKSDLAKEAELATFSTPTPAPAVSTANPTANEGRVRAKDMADVYDGFGEGRMGSPRSPTRPHSMRRRQSMQVLDLEQKLEQLAAENRILAEAKAQADRALHSSQNAPSVLVEKDAEIDSLKRTLEWLQNEVTRLTEVNEGLTSANLTIARQHGDQYGILESQHTQTARELQEVRDAHENLSAGMEGIVRNEVQNAVLDKDREIAQLRAELDSAKEQIRDMQRQILASKASDLEFLTVRDEDYFDNACQQLCQHVQQWVLRFSKFSDMRACRLTSEINNDKTIDRLDNAILDGSDVDNYLADRVKRRDVFMSMTMTMVWEFIFTRYLFGMDREQRQKLKSLEKTLSEVGPPAAVHQWRATTLTLLAKREAFRAQREQDTQAVVHAVLETLSEILPPPSHLETQIEEQLTRVMKAAVDLSIEMRCQRAEYMMLPPLQPEYDANGDLASKVSFNAALMNERSGDTVSNEELEGQKAVVRIVLFPLVVKKGDDSGDGDEEIVVCPAQVLVAKPKKSVRMLAPEGNDSRVSMQSSMPAGDSVM